MLPGGEASGASVDDGTETATRSAEAGGGGLAGSGLAGEETGGTGSADQSAEAAGDASGGGDDATASTGGRELPCHSAAARRWLAFIIGGPAGGCGLAAQATDGGGIAAGA